MAMALVREEAYLRQITSRDKTLTPAERLASLERFWVRHRDDAVRRDRNPAGRQFDASPQQTT